MNDKEALQEVVYMTNDYINNRNKSAKNFDFSNYEFINQLVKFLEENVIHCAIDNHYK